MYAFLISTHITHIFSYVFCIESCRVFVFFVSLTFLCSENLLLGWLNLVRKLRWSCFSVLLIVSFSINVLLYQDYLSIYASLISISYLTFSSVFNILGCRFSIFFMNFDVLVTWLNLVNKLRWSGLWYYISSAFEFRCFCDWKLEGTSLELFLWWLVLSNLIFRWINNWTMKMWTSVMFHVMITLPFVRSWMIMPNLGFWSLGSRNEH